MFSGYNLKIKKCFFKNKKKSFEEYIEIGEQHLNSQINAYKNGLNQYVHNGTINGSKLQSDIFPTVDADIFISHSHKDKNLANALAGWLHEEFRLDVFIDSNVWGYSEELLEIINSKYSNKRRDTDRGYLYDYQACNIASQHVNIMLSIALQKMIDKVECIMLLNTDNSISVFNDDDKQFNSTYSPWLYSEIICTQIVRKKPLLYYRDYSKLCHANESVSEEYKSCFSLEIAYTVSLLHLTELNASDLIEWSSKYNFYGYDYEYALDALYSFKHPEEYKTAKLLAEKYNFDSDQLRKCFDCNSQIHQANFCLQNGLKSAKFENGKCPLLMNDWSSLNG